MRRRIYAEDPDWSLATVPSLSNLCLQSIMTKFKEKPVFEDLTPTQKDFMQERLSTSVPLQITANLISDGVYWKRCCEQRWELCDVSRYDHSWKQMFFERHLENIIELFVPNATDPMTVLQMVPLCKNYVRRLDITQLLPPIKEPHKEEDQEAENDLELKSESDFGGPSMDHFDFNILLHQLTNLEELHLVYQVKQCGMNFEWTMFEMTGRDCESLARALKSCKTLKVLRLHQSHIDDKKCYKLVKYLLGHPSLRELDLSHNLIGDKGARAISQLLNKSNLKMLNMCNNIIANSGATALAQALSQNSTLHSLNLRLNCLQDEGGEAIGKALLKNNTLRHLHLGANEVTAPTAITLAKALVQNNTLRSINLSCNNLGVDGGKALQEAMSHNITLTECDIRLTEVKEQSASFINQVVLTNQGLEQKRQTKRE